MKKKKEKKRLEQDILIAMEEYILAKNILEISELTKCICEERRMWHKTLIQHYDYFDTLLQSYQRKAGFVHADKPEHEAPMQIGNHIYKRDTVIGKAEYNDFLFRVVTSYPFQLEFDANRMKKLFFVLKNGKEIMSVCPSIEYAAECAESTAKVHKENFYDVCWWNERRAFTHLHFDYRE